MTTFIVGVLTVFLILNCLLLILLVLVQLPKKDAGAGLAFGSGAADALFGAGSGNALTKITKYATVIFLVLAVILGYVEDGVSGNRGSSNFAKQVAQQQQQQQASGAAPVPTSSSAPASPSITPQLSTNSMSVTPVQSTNSAK